MNTPAAPSFAQPLFSAGRLTVFAVAAVTAVAGARWFPMGGWALPLAVAAIAIAIWHGAFDVILAEEVLQPRFGDLWKLPFYSAYIALGAAVLLLWWYAPVVALPAFLLYSALHFGTETDRELSPLRLLTGLATGFVPIAATCYWWPKQVAAIYGMMLRGSAGAATPITTLAGRALWPAVAVAVTGALLQTWINRRRALRQGARPAGISSWLVPGAVMGTELLLFRGCSPVVAFAIFFCLWHTPEHMLSTSLDRLGHFRRDLLLHHLRRGFAPWLLSLAGLAVACWLGRREVQSYVGLLFIALSALTVPHMALSELCRRQSLSSSEVSAQNFVSREVVVP